MRKSKNPYFYHILVSPGDAPGAITLNVVCMERECDAYKLSRCMCPSNYNRFWDTARYWSKIIKFFIPPCIRRLRKGGSRRNIATLFGREKPEWCGYQMMKKFWRDVYSFWPDTRTWRTDGQTPGDGNSRAMHIIVRQRLIKFKMADGRHVGNIFAMP